ncbi:UDP-2,3-diacylglucosamine hydrolase [Flavobacterium noncentrifugens]|uniref:UDP-2,3-diacylglucosamine pyrophosphatase LpxH n=1 Tax=Flavobacterium noncentrifugens TaxID=1128970 RepID=A0A1G8ZYD4_9FLAO|nr:UDP-2,3-diacylglucosamine diphosphatase [Flavobacterium noncentrifugens]GEP51813.1 UDP-2,3-diacylglucosamine hydrolase [Flavobacterium noncentrifugens]SDK19140.1 UDP-2,3-diacylglucosamine pyrophosphatase LpxH [Flavobacterium noncentrifugens]
MKKRKVEVVVLSDVHLGTFGCHAKELMNYLSSVKPKILVLNGDIIDIWQFRKSYFPKQHLRVIRKILDLASKGTKVYYITGNHDELLRKFSDTVMGNFTILDKLVLELDEKKAWIFHGDVFDVSVQHSKWIAKLGGLGYDYLILLNRFVNWCLYKMGSEPYSFSKKIKASVKKAVKHISDFETTATDLAIEKKYDYVICGHIHEPKIIEKTNKNGSTLYLNSGDWVENLTALEYNRKRWKMYRYADTNYTEEEDLFEMENAISNQLIASIVFSKKINSY